MKRITFISMLSLLIPFAGFSQTEQVFDDIYFKPSDAKNVEKTIKTNRAPQYKNGAKEIIYIDRENGNTQIVQRDTVYILGQANDSTEYMEDEGYYMNGFKGTESDLEYAERIRKFHNPKYEIFIADPRYNDIYFLNDNDWNVYVDGSYAYITPTWTNPYWWNYNYSPYSYGGYGGYGGWGLGHGWNSPYYGYGGWNSFYGGFGGWGGYYGYGNYWGGYGYGGYGYGGYGGYGYPYYGYGYGDYYGYNNWYGNSSYSNQNPNHTEQSRRDVSNSISGGSRLGGTTNPASSVRNSDLNARTSRNPYTTISGSGSRSGSSANSVNSSIGNRTSNSNDKSVTRTTRNVQNGNGIGVVRSGGIRNNNYNSRSTTTNPTTSSSTIDTSPRTNRGTTVTTRSSNNNYGVTRESGTTNSRGTRSTYSNSGSSSRSSYPSYNNSSRSSSSYSTPSSSYSSGSSSSSSSRSSSSSSSSSSSGGSRSSSSGSGGSRR